MSAIQSVGGAEQDMGLGSLLRIVGRQHRRTIAGALCPNRYCTSSSLASFSIAQVANVWRKRCTFTFATPTRPPSRLRKISTE